MDPDLAEKVYEFIMFYIWCLDLLGMKVPHYGGYSSVKYLDIYLFDNG
jgi:hypothetical protein